MMKKKDNVSNSNSCGHCQMVENSENKLKYCSRCKIVGYCSKECQIADWKSGGHKDKCIAVKDRKPSNNPPPKATSNKQNNCVICLESLHPSQASILPCKHSFHVDCVSSLREKALSAVCPLCRTDLPPVNKTSNKTKKTTFKGLWLDKDRDRSFCEVFASAVEGEGADLEARKMLLEIANQYNQNKSAFILKDRRCNKGRGHYVGIDVYSLKVTNLDEPAVDVQYTFSSNLSAVELFLRDEDIVSLPCSFEAQKLILASLYSNANSINSQKGLLDIISGLLLRESFLSPMTSI